MTKKLYIQPEVQVTQIALGSMVLVGSAAVNTMNMNNTEGDQW